MISKKDRKITKALGNKLRKAREELKLTQADVSIKTDMTENYYAMIERGEVNPSYAKLRKLFNFLKINSSELPL